MGETQPKHVPLHTLNIFPREYLLLLLEIVEGKVICPANICALLSKAYSVALGD